MDAPLADLLHRPMFDLGRQRASLRRRKPRTRPPDGPANGPATPKIENATRLPAHATLQAGTAPAQGSEPTAIRYIGAEAGGRIGAAQQAGAGGQGKLAA